MVLVARVQSVVMGNAGFLPVCPSVVEGGVFVSLLDINQDAFCTWLCMHEHEVVGHPQTCFQSPLALWLSEMTGHMYGVDGKVYGRASWEYCHWLLLPRWAEMFTAQVEGAFARVITGHEAFSALAHVEAALKPPSSRRQMAYV